MLHSIAKVQQKSEKKLREPRVEDWNTGQAGHDRRVDRLQTEVLPQGQTAKKFESKPRPGSKNITSQYLNDNAVAQELRLTPIQERSPDGMERERARSDIEDKLTSI
jgi:hypothetical protein